MNKKILSLLTLCAVILGLLCTISCQGPATEDKGEGSFKIGISLMNRQQSFYNDLEEAFTEAAKENGVTLDIKNAEQDSAKQLSGVETMLISNIDALIVCPVDSSAAGSCVKAANAKGIPVFTVDIGSESGDVVCHIASDNIAGGKEAAEYIVKALEEKGKVVILNSPQVTSVQERVEGFKEIVEKYPHIEIIADIDGGAQKEPSMKAMEDAIQANEVINAVFAINDETALGALRAVEGASKEGVIIVGYDATPEARKEILKGGPLKADVVQNPKEMGKIAIETVVKYLNGEEVPEKIPVKVGILDKAALEKGETVDTEDVGGSAEAEEESSGTEETH